MWQCIDVYMYIQYMNNSNDKHGTVAAAVPELVLVLVLVLVRLPGLVILVFGVTVSH